MPSPTSFTSFDLKTISTNTIQYMDNFKWLNNRSNKKGRATVFIEVINHATKLFSVLCNGSTGNLRTVTQTETEVDNKVETWQL